ncbi:uncharacterized protein LOC124355828 [Homalodisca vitripennis]|uniref:uncharacterized protein LOC124355828 n=1 Tax=Homalodisca vitripennis TaxID=197043 RepID=UPI001EEBB706|nr:uncharacterized protein LOC124355828 [Homalodisca vitripennis]
MLQIEVVIEYLVTLFQKCLDGEEIPKEWKIAHISSLYKKGDKKNCENYRGLSVTASTGRLYGRKLRDRIEQEITDKKEQNGFRPRWSCIDNVFCLKQMIEKTLAHNAELHIAFIDLKKAYDSITIKRLWEALENSEINIKYINAVKNMYEGEDDLEYMLRKLTEEYEGWGLEGNMEKTQYLVIGREGRDLNINGNVIKNVEEYNYLGCTITNDGRDEKDIMNKVTKGKSIVKSLSRLRAGWSRDPPRYPLVRSSLQGHSSPPRTAC